jgi:SpoVK/Ycf46/Vps4 family AAA+-type ATPase
MGRRNTASPDPRAPSSGELSMEDQLVRLLEAALAGGAGAAERYARGIMKSLGPERHVMLTAIQNVLRDAPRGKAPFRSETIAAIPVDIDSRMQLVKYEHPVVLEREPIFVEALHRDLMQLVAERRRLPELRQAGVSPTRSALFYGAPGVGKTLAARWLARELGIPLLILDLSSVMSSFLGRTGVNIRNVLDYAKGVKCVLLLDEVDAIAKRRDDVVEIGELKRLVTVLLQEVDSWPDSGLLIAATNHPELLDRAVWRRFDTVLQFEVPPEDLMMAAIRASLPELSAADRELRLLSLVYSGAAISDVQRDIQRLRRQSIVSDVPLENLIKPFVKARVMGDSRGKRLELSRKLLPEGFSQREIHDLTGVSRDTLRKAQVSAYKR